MIKQLELISLIKLYKLDTNGNKHLSFVFLLFLIAYIQGFFKTLLHFVSLGYINNVGNNGVPPNLPPNLPQIREKQLFVDNFNEFTGFGFDTVALATLPFRTKVKAAQYKSQLRKFYRENPNDAPNNPE